MARWMRVVAVMTALGGCAETPVIQTVEIIRDFQVAGLAFTVRSDGYSAQVDWPALASLSEPNRRSTALILLAAEATTNCRAVPKSLRLLEGRARVDLDCTRAAKVSL